MSSTRAIAVPSTEKTNGQNDRRKRILDAARKAFSENGFARTDLRDVARIAHVGKATLYRYYGSKNDLLLAIAVAGIEDLRDRMVAGVSQAGDPKHVVGETIRSALRFFDENRELARVLLVEAGELRGEIAARYFDLYSASKSAAGAIFSPTRMNPGLSDYGAGQIADVLMYLVAGRVLVWLLSGHPARLEDDADILYRMFVHGIYGKETDF
ncbi:MAG: TetR/AcrR family transcriptional regulator [Bdellovibrionota bacterium]